MTGAAGVQIKLGTQPLIVVYRRGERAGKIQIAFQRDGSDNLILRVRDGGVGCACVVGKGGRHGFKVRSLRCASSMFAGQTPRSL